MATPLEAIKAAHQALGALVEHQEAISSAEERRQGIETLTAQVTRDHATAKDRLEQVRRELANSEDALKSKSHIIDDERARALKDYQVRINESQQKLDDLNKQVADKEQRHTELIQSMEALRKRLL